MQNFEKIRKIIHHEFPDFFISSIKKIGEGDNSKAFLINKNYIFRFPKREEVKQHLKKEILVLPKIRPYLNLPIPAFEFISKEINFVGYKIIAGDFLDISIYNSLQKKIQTKIQKSLAVFLSQLHKINLSILKDCGLETISHRDEYLNDFENAKKLILPNLPKVKREIINQSFKDYLDNPKNFKYKPALVHNDFSPDHILIEKSTSHISGIIDFGDLAIGDPDYDLMYLFDSLGEEFLIGIPQFYKHSNHENLLKKLNFLSLANKLQILIIAIKDKDDSEMENGYRNLKTWLKNYQQLYLFTYPKK